MDKKSGSRRRSHLARTLNLDAAGSPVASSREPEASDLSALMDCIRKWIEKIRTPEFMKFKHDQIGYVLASDLIRNIVWPNGVSDFELSDNVIRQHQLVMSFLYLHQAVQVLSQCDHYFRRYPFSDEQVPREDHARNMCEFYFGQFYVIECRIKEVMKHLKTLGIGNIADPGRIIRRFHTEFPRELSMRGGAVHQQPFDDPDLDRPFLTRVISTGPNLSEASWRHQHLRHYRRFASTWSKQASRRSADARAFLDAIARMLLEHATFLSE